jgi:hypothetical protein
MNMRACTGIVLIFNVAVWAFGSGQRLMAQGFTVGAAFGVLCTISVAGMITASIIRDRVA